MRSLSPTSLLAFHFSVGWPSKVSRRFCPSSLYLGIARIQLDAHAHGRGLTRTRHRVCCAMNAGCRLARLASGLESAVARLRFLFA